MLKGSYAKSEDWKSNLFAINFCIVFKMVVQGGLLDRGVIIRENVESIFGSEFWYLLRYQNSVFDTGIVIF